MSSPPARLPFYQDPQFFRPQTYALLLAFVLLLLALFLPMVTFTFGVQAGGSEAGAASGQVTVHLNRFDVRGNVPDAARAALEANAWWLQLLTVLTAFAVGAAGASLFRYRNLKQLSTTTTVLLFTLLGLVLLRFVARLQIGSALEAVAPLADRGAEVAYFLPTVALIAIVFARDRVRRDARALRDAERFY